MTLLLLFLPLGLFSQNWRNICSAGKTFYVDTAFSMAAFRLDSVQVQSNGDTIYYSYLTLRGANAVCLDSLYGSVLGNKVIGKAGGLFCFFNASGDSLWINTTAELNDSWEFLHPQSGNIITARVIDIKPDTIMGVIDSVRFISLRDNHQTVDAVIKLSKHYGLTQIPDLYYVPAITGYFTLAGKSAAGIGFQQCMRAQGIYDFSVGDEFHYYHTKDIAYPRHFDTTEIRKVLAVSWSADSGSVIYKFRRCMHVQHVWEYPVDTIYADTVDWKYNFSATWNNTYLVSLPGEKDGVWAHDFIYHQYNQRSTSYSRYGQYWYYTSASCWKSGGGGGVLVAGNSYFAPGLGMTGLTSEGHSTGEWLELKYYSKGSESWGSPVDVECAGTGIEENLPGLNVQVSPNPAADKFSVSIPGINEGERFTYSVRDLLGRRFLSGSFPGRSCFINGSGMPSGLYILMLNDSRGRSFPAVKVLLK